jgi:hypothetical protein
MIWQSAQGTVGRSEDTNMRVSRLKRDPVGGARGQVHGRGWTVAMQVVTLLSFRRTAHSRSLPLTTSQSKQP